MKRIASLTLIGLCTLAFTTFATPPVATPSFGQTWEDTEGEVVLNYTDDDGDLATDCHVYNVVGGTVLNISVVEGVCTVTFMPDLNNDVNVTGEFTVTAGGEVSNTSTFELELIEVNDPPVMIANPPTEGQYGETWLCVITYEDPEDDNMYVTCIGDMEYAPHVEGELIENGGVVFDVSFYHGPVDFIMFLTDDGLTNAEYDPQTSDTLTWQTIFYPCFAYYDIDDSDPQFVILNGDWQTYQYPDAKGGSLHYHRPGNSQQRAGWRVDQLVEPGWYDVYVWIISNSYDLLASRFHYITFYAVGTTRTSRSSDTNYTQWYYIGRYPISNSHTQGAKTLSKPDGIVYADAIRYVKFAEFTNDGDSEPGLIDPIPEGEHVPTWGVLRTQAETEAVR
ncbi:hypothetical protein KQI52_12295 [bacterium]|nr:hypothetical protein [bacterium]